MSSLDADFAFNVVLFKKIVVITNDTMLILSLFNVLSIWFDLHVYVYRAKYLCLHLQSVG